MTPVYPTLESIYNRYSNPAREIIFEGHSHKFVGLIPEKDIQKHVYRDEAERHTLVIYVSEGDPYYIDARYSIHDEDVHALQKMQA